MSELLVIYNLAADEDSPVLAASLDWVNKFSFNFCKVNLYSSYVGRHETKSNVAVSAIGTRAQSTTLRIFFNLMRSVKETLKNEFPKKYIFYHMSHKPVLVIGLIYKILGYKQVLWYSHHKKSLSLLVASCLVDYCVSTNDDTFPIETKKFRAIGHGIDSKKFNFSEREYSIEQKKYFLVIGRISPVKKIEKMITALPKTCVLLLIGGSEDDNYLKKLEKLAEEKQIKIQNMGALPFTELPNYYKKYCFGINCTPKSVDKAILEESMCGVIPISDNENVLGMTGMSEVWKIELNRIPTLQDQICYLLDLSNEKLRYISKYVSEISTHKNDLEVLIERIISLFRTETSDIK